ncbi:hypothetical protein WN59_08105 [Salinicoccus sediminis]|uniref:DinB-like domain-containing protein n=1 Tax=Salinicoccus sediminis TaxID=1432562 RepID=A0A0M2SMY1_9STAP|nr:DinB family protein [Salinicoccus sediminis]KKK34232.1 hypothetical protein WN59_08105 [Salinicoccus sediminis]
MHRELEEIFEELEALRNDYFSTVEFNDDLYRRDVPDKWSVGEVIYHCWLLLKYFRMLSGMYNPPARAILKLYRQSPAEYDAHMENIYAGETMKSPAILVPQMKREYSKGELRMMLEDETEKLKKTLDGLDSDALYRVRYPDPVAGCPNIIQSVKLAKIHEAHHYGIVLERVRENR